MLDGLILYVLPLLGGIVIGTIFWRNKEGPIETVIMSNLRAGKKVIVCIDEDAYIFEMYGNRMRISLGTTQIMEEEHVDLGVVNLDQSSDDSTSRH